MNFSIEFLFELNSALVEGQTCAHKIKFMKIASGASIKPPAPPKILQKEPETSVPPPKPTEIPTKDSSGLRKMEEVPKEELIELNKSLPKFDGLPFRTMEPQELERWMSNQCIKALFDQTNAVIQIFTSKNIAPPPKLLNQQQVLKEKHLENARMLKSKQISLQDYVKKIALQVQTDKRDVKAIGIDTPAGKSMIQRIKLILTFAKSVIRLSHRELIIVKHACSV